MANIENLKPFQKGHTLTKGIGRPKGSKSLTTLLREAMDKPLSIKTKKGEEETKTVAEWIVGSLIKKSIEGEIKATKEVLDRLDGKTVQVVENTKTLDLSNINLSSLSSEQIQKLIDDNMPNEE